MLNVRHSETKPQIFLSEDVPRMMLVMVDNLVIENPETLQMQPYGQQPYSPYGQMGGMWYGYPQGYPQGMTPQMGYSQQYVAQQGYGYQG